MGRADVKLLGIRLILLIRRCALNTLRVSVESLRWGPGDKTREASLTELPKDLTVRSRYSMQSLRFHTVFDTRRELFLESFSHITSFPIVIYSRVSRIYAATWSWFASTAFRHLSRTPLFNLVKIRDPFGSTQSARFSIFFCREKLHYMCQFPRRPGRNRLHLQRTKPSPENGSPGTDRGLP